ncbi:unnamed protein product [Merluccius merluccius]
MKGILLQQCTEEDLSVPVPLVKRAAAAQSRHSQGPGAKGQLQITDNARFVLLITPRRISCLRGSSSLLSPLWSDEAEEEEAAEEEAEDHQALIPHEQNQKTHRE